MASKRKVQVSSAPRSAREGALQVLYAVEVEGAYANLVLDRLLREAPINALERSLLTELVYGTLRWRNTIDWALERLVKKGVEGLTPWMRNLLRLSAYQLLFLDRIPPAAVCNEGTKLAHRYGHRGVAGLVNGVLRNLSRQGKELPFPRPEDDPVKHLAVRWSHPEWMVERWLKRYGFSAARSLCQVNNQPAPHWVRANTLRQDTDELARLLELQGLKVGRSGRVEEGLKLCGEISYADMAAHREGRFYIQDESSMLVAHALAPLAGSRVVDACAGPGGKTSHFAQLMRDSGEIRAFDIHRHKLALVESTCRRLGISCVKTEVLDARSLPGGLAGWADQVLVDAPCSGLGVIRRRPDLRWRKNADEVKELSVLQKDILSAASSCVRPGGALVYSTCTLEPEENEDVVNWLTGRTGFYLEDLNPYLPGEGWTEEDRRLMKRGYLTLLPHVHGSDGFFIARLRRPK